MWRSSRTSVCNDSSRRTQYHQFHLRLGKYPPIQLSLNDVVPLALSCSFIAFSFQVAWLSCTLIAWRVACFLSHAQSFWRVISFYCQAVFSFASIGHCHLRIMIESWMEQVCVDVDSCLCFGRWDSQVKEWSLWRGCTGDWLIKWGSAVHMALLVHPCLQRLLAIAPRTISFILRLENYPSIQSLNDVVPLALSCSFIVFSHHSAWLSCTSIAWIILVLMYINRVARCILLHGLSLNKESFASQ